MSFFENTRKPEGLGGKLMVNMMNSGHAALARWGMAHIAFGKNDACLDVGCGGGANVRRLLEKSGGRVVGLDYSSVSVEKSRRLNRAAIDAGRCEILHGDVMALPFPPQSFDVVTAFETVYFWPDIARAFAQIYAVLKLGGVFMICNESSGETDKNEKWTKIIGGMRIYKKSQLEPALIEAGFSSVKSDLSKDWLCIIAHKEA